MIIFRKNPLMLFTTLQTQQTHDKSTNQTPTNPLTPPDIHKHTSYHNFTNYPTPLLTPEIGHFPPIPARSAHITPPARRRSASRAYARENTLPSSAKWGPFRCSFSERTRKCSQSDPTYLPYYPPILQQL